MIVLISGLGIMLTANGLQRDYYSGVFSWEDLVYSFMVATFVFSYQIGVYYAARLIRSATQFMILSNMSILFVYLTEIFILKHEAQVNWIVGGFIVTGSSIVASLYQ